MIDNSFQGTNQLVSRLAAQVGSVELAQRILVRRGHMRPDGSLTPDGEARNQMSAADRAKDRAARRSGKPPASYRYNSSTNRAEPLRAPRSLSFRG